MDDRPVESRKGESKSNWIWVILGLLILVAVVVWLTRKGLDTEAGTEPSTLGASQRPAVTALLAA